MSYTIEFAPAAKKVLKEMEKIQSCDLSESIRNH